MSQLNVTTAPRTTTFHMRMNPEIKSKLEELYAGYGLTLSDAVNMFFQQSLNEGGFPSQISESGKLEWARHRLLAEISAGFSSAGSENDWIDQEDIAAEFGVQL